MAEFQTALPAISGDVFHLTRGILESGLEAARNSPRKRIVLPIHRSPEALVQRMLNFMLPGTNFRPHRHPRDSAIETIQVIQGELGILIFEADGSVREVFRLSSDGLGLIDIEPNVWHGLVVLAPDTVILEIKRGPYDLKRDKIFPEWAPEETDPGADAYRQSLEKRFE